MENCHGCKWLDEVKPKRGDGYCTQIVRSKGLDKEKVRREHSERCELYEPGDFATRFSAGRKGGVE